MQSKEEDTVAMEDSQAHSLRNAQKGEKALRLRLDDVTLERVSSVFRVEARCFLLDPTNQTCVFANDDGSFGDQLTANAVLRGERHGACAGRRRNITIRHRELEWKLSCACLSGKRFLVLPLCAAWPWWNHCACHEHAQTLTSIGSSIEVEVQCRVRLKQDENNRLS